MSDSLIAREYEVLGPGLADGLKQAVFDTFGKVESGAAAFVSKPIATTGGYLKDHYKDIAAGALIGLISPRGFAGALLLGYSLRGVAAATGEAAVQAADPNVDISAARKQFASAIGNEGTAFASALPATMAGGVLGGMASRALFGEAGAAQFASGRLSAQDIRSNLRNFGDQIWQPRKSVLITDLDDTAFDMKSYLVRTLLAGNRMISEKMGIPESEVIKAIGRDRLHPWSLETSPLSAIYKGTTDEFTASIVKPFWKIHDDNMATYLKPYDSVAETMAAARAQHIRVVGLTNAPLPLALARVRAAGLDGLIDRLYAIESHEPAPSAVSSPSLLDNGRQMVSHAVNNRGQLRNIAELPVGFMKPDVRGLQRVLHDESIRPAQALAIGDNLKGDGTAPAKLKVPFVWAKYGLEVLEETRAVLGRGKAASAENNPGSGAESTPAPTPPTLLDAQRFADVLPLLKADNHVFSVAERLGNMLYSSGSWLPALGYDLITSAQPEASFSGKHTLLSQRLEDESP